MLFTKPHPMNGCAKIKHKKNQIKSKMEMFLNSDIYTEASTKRLDFGHNTKDRDRERERLRERD